VAIAVLRGPEHFRPPLSRREGDEAVAGGDPGLCPCREEAERARGFEAFVAGWRYGWKRGASASPREAEEQGYGTLVESACFCRGSEDGAAGDTWRLDRVAERCPGLAGAVDECKRMLAGG